MIQKLCARAGGEIQFKQYHKRIPKKTELRSINLLFALPWGAINRKPLPEATGKGFPTGDKERVPNAGRLSG
jgi:hypothetical protein